MICLSIVAAATKARLAGNAEEQRAVCGFIDVAFEDPLQLLSKTDVSARLRLIYRGVRTGDNLNHIALLGEGWIEA